MPGAAPAPHAMAAGRDYEFDSYKPFFYDEDCAWDFYQSTAPSEDIWKKFELLPTPPLSPNRANSMLLLPSGDPSYDDTTDLLDDEIESRSVLLDPICDYGSGRSRMKAVVLQDCMWSGFSARATLEKFVTEKLAAKKFGGLPSSAGVSLLSTSPGEGGCAGVGGAGPCSASLVVTSAVVDPAEMLPFGPGGQHLPAEGQSQGDDEEEEDGETTENGVMSPGNETPSDSDDDDDDDDEDEEEEDEEIDVVTVEKRGPAKKSVAVRTVYNTNTARQYNQQQQQRSAPAYTSRGHIPPVHQQHNYAAPSPPPCKVENPPAAKRFRPDVHPAVAPTPPPVARGPTQSRGGSSSASSSRANSTGCGSPRSSDSEDQDKRRTHNILERQRRNDLKNSFFWLRDHIPELAHNDKAAKVQILKKAMEYSRTLQRQEKKLEAEKRQQQIRHQELLKRLEILRNSKTKRS
uniref:N-Myc n=1 Tax=Petromyzon marinus TaxID=7757 RepID=A8TXE8_PETMA|nr:n-Myc [Petromyzon marinus]